MLDPNVTMEDVAEFARKEKNKAEGHHKVEKDSESAAYYSGQIDLLDRLGDLINK